MLQLINQVYSACIGFDILVVILGLWLSWRAPANGRVCALRVLGMTVVFSIMDLLLLQGLTWLKQSYGPAEFPFVVLLGARLGIFFLWVFSWRFKLNPRQSLPAEKALRQGGWVCLGLNILALLLVVYAFYMEPFMLTTSQVQVETPKFSTGAHLRIVQISDLHVERLTRREYAVIRQVNALNPDVIVVTGDYPNLSFINDVTTWDQITYVIGQLKARYGVFLINGSNESPTKVRELAKNSGAVALTDHIYPLDWEGGKLYLMGVNDTHSRDNPPVPNFLALDQEIPVGAFTLMLYHTPDLIKSAAPAGVDLYLCGHTHGGQIRLPFYGAVFTSSIYYKEFEMGLYHVGPTTLYVNRGLGMEGMDAPRARFLAPPEIAIFDLMGTGK
jgi:uncharacterized protein